MQNKQDLYQLEEFFTQAQTWFEQYVGSFDDHEQDVHLALSTKKEHTQYVVSLCTALAKHLRLKPYDVSLAATIGLLHDIGRFAQYSKYRTFNDAASQNHATIALELLPQLPNWSTLAGDAQKIIIFAIANHNAKIIAPTTDDRQLLFARLLRDSDKIDIYRVLEPYLTPADESLCGTQFIDALENGQQGDYRQMRSMNDHKVVRLLWAYDLNFAWSVRQILQKGYIEKIIASLPDNPIYKKGIHHLRTYLNEKAAADDVC